MGLYSASSRGTSLLNISGVLLLNKTRGMEIGLTGDMVDDAHETGLRGGFKKTGMKEWQAAQA